MLPWATYAIASAAALSIGTPPGAYQFTIERGWLRMPDGVRLAVTYWRPTPRTSGERFPVLLEYLPYRKEDSFYQRDYPLYSWFVRRGYIMAKVDIRGTGSSDGHLPDREYSEQEGRDADAIIADLAALPGSNGAVGMWGISWGGFNAIQIAMRRPPALKAILAADATDDLFHDDVHQIDGVLHVDQYALQIDHENGLPAPPDYPVDSAYFANRFDTYPWLLTYLHHDVDGPWWRWNSLRFHYDAITIPCFLIGGLLDGYRDAVPRMLDSVRAPIKALVGPWNHTFPDDAVPGPPVEWREEAARWWDHWLKGVDNGATDGPRLTVFVRDSSAPDVNRTTTPGAWRGEAWPIARTQWRTWYLAGDHQLVDRPPTAGQDALRYVGGVGTAVPVWWNDATGDLSADDGASLTYDTAPFSAPAEIIGFPRVSLRASVDASIADWAIRLEDVAPDGRVALITGALSSGAQRASRLDPAPLPRDTMLDLVTGLHFTTWTFEPGHRARVAVSNSQFPMAWPTPGPMTMRLVTGDPRSAVVLPIVAPVPGAPAPGFAPLGGREHAPDARTIHDTGYPGAVITRNVGAKTTAVDFLTRFAYAIGPRTIDDVEKEHYETRDDDPADTRFLGDETHVIRLRGGRTVRLHTVIDMHSDRAVFHVRVTREIAENGRVIRTRTWAEAIPRGIH